MYTAPYHHVRNYTLQSDSWTDQQSNTQEYSGVRPHKDRQNNCGRHL